MTIKPLFKGDGIFKYTLNFYINESLEGHRNTINNYIRKIYEYYNVDKRGSIVVGRQSLDNCSIIEKLENYIYNLNQIMMYNYYIKNKYDDLQLYCDNLNDDLNEWCVECTVKNCTDRRWISLPGCMIDLQSHIKDNFENFEITDHAKKEIIKFKKCLLKNNIQNIEYIQNEIYLLIKYSKKWRKSVDRFEKTTKSENDIMICEIIFDDINHLISSNIFEKYSMKFDIKI